MFRLAAIPASSPQPSPISYDLLYRLTNATYSGAATSTFDYAYDAAGNRTAYTQTVTDTLVTTYTYDAANRLASAAGVPYTWDNSGNLTNDGGKTYTYDQANRLTGVSATGLTWSATYNGDDARLRQIVNAVPATYTLDLAAPLVQVLVQEEAGGKTAYLYGVTRVGEQQPAGWVYHLPDALGSVRQLVDGSAQAVLVRGYMPYGEALWSVGASNSAYGFTGEVLDASVGLTFLRARYMHPGLGIFLSRDRWAGDGLQPGSLNGWSYGLGNPVKYTDPSGNFPYDEGCDELGWGFPAKTLWCEPIVGGSLDATVSLVTLLARTMPLFGWRHGADNLNHYIWGGGSDKIYSSKWYLDQTPYNEVWRSWLRARLMARDDLLNKEIYCAAGFNPAPLQVLLDADGDVKATLGRHYVYGLVTFSNNLPLEYDCVCAEAGYYIQYYIDDPYDFDPIDPQDPSHKTRQYLPTSSVGVGGFGLTPFEWLYDLQLAGRAYAFHTRIYWAELIDDEGRQLLHNEDVRLPWPHHVEVIP